MPTIVSVFENMPTIVSVFGVEPKRIGGTETFARELSRQLGERGWKSVLCFFSEPAEEVRRFLDLQNISLEVIAGPLDGNWTSLNKLSRILRHHRPDILHLHYSSFLSLYAWLGRILSVKKIFFTDHHSRPSGYVSARAPFWKREAARLINRPLTKVISVSNYGYRCMTSLDLLRPDRFKMIYNGVDLSRVSLSGYLLDRGDTKKMGERILALLGDSKLRAEMGRSGCETVSAKFNLRKNVTQLIGFYGLS